MKIPCVVYWWTLICQLKTTLSHSEMHCIHVNFTRKRLWFSSFSHVCIFILKYRHSNLYLFSPSFSYRLNKPRKSRMSVNCTVVNKLWLRIFIELYNSIHRFIDSFLKFFLKLNMIFSPQSWYISHTYEIQSMIFEKLFKNLSSFKKLFFTRKQLSWVNNTIVRL